MFSVFKKSFVRFSLIFTYLFIFITYSSGQNNKRVLVRVISSHASHSVPGASVVLLPDSSSYVCDNNGELLLPIRNDSVSHQLIISAVGFVKSLWILPPHQNNITITLEQSITTLTEIVVSGSRKAERLLSAPVTIEKYSAKAIKETPSLDFFDGLKNLKGIDLVNSGLNYKQINTRGFAGTMNSRFLILIDGMDMQAPGLGWSLGNQYGTTDLDIEDAELIPGAASALYGPTAFNGMLSMHTKDPFKTTGLSWTVKTGLNHFGDVETGVHGLNEITLRTAQKIGERFAYKVNISGNNGLDWFANDYTDINQKTPVNLRGPLNPARDALNIYGDEIQKTIPGIGLVSRTGYEEKHLADYRVYGFKMNTSLQYKIKEDLRLTYFQSFGIGNMNYTGSSRYSTKNFEFNTAKLELKSKNFFIRSYRIWENSRGDFNSRTLAQYINRSWVKDLNGNAVAFDKADETWFQRYEAAFKGQVAGVQADNHTIARSFADISRVIPGSDNYNTTKEYYKNRYAPNGASILTKTSFIHNEAQYDFNKFKQIAEISTGASLRIYHLLSNGSLFNTTSKGITYKEYGLFLQMQKSLLKDKVKLTSSLRYDKSQNFKGSLTPKLALSIQANKNGFIRASYQTGFRNPTTVDQYVSLRSGLITLLGGAPANSKGTTVYENSFTAATVAQFSAAFNQAIANGLSYDQAINSNLSLLKKSNYKYIQPEKQKAFELGYKTAINNRLFVDINVYYSRYSNFIVNANVVNTFNNVLNAQGSANYMAANDILSGKSTTYQLYTNSNASVSTYGYSTGIFYRLLNGLEINSNLTYSKLNASTINTNLIAPFNTPNFSSTTTISKTKLAKNIGFSVSWHWQNAFNWYGTFTGYAPGKINAYHLIDAQVSKYFNKKKMTMKIGVNNLLNHHVVQTYGSPAIGAIGFISFTHGI